MIIKILELIGYIIPCIFYIFLFFISYKEGNKLQIFSFLIFSPILIILSIIKEYFYHNDYNNYIHVIISLYIIIMMNNMSSNNKIANFLFLLFTTIATSIPIYEFYLSHFFIK